MPVNVLVVDDSVVVRRLVSTVLGEDPDICVVGTAASGRIALDKVDTLHPDLVTLDIEMPEMDGLETLRHLRRRHPALPVLMFSTLTERAAAATLEALALGARDYATKPAGVGSLGAAIEVVRGELVRKVKALCPERVARSASANRPAVPAGRRGLRTVRPEVLAVGASTGGPDALATVLGALPADLGVPVVVVQHMPPVFTRLFAQRLDRLSPLRVLEATAGEPLCADTVYVAPGDQHLSVTLDRGSVRTVLDQQPPENFCRPAVDVLFRSVAQVYGARAVALVLTGMGQDGLRGVQRLREHGAEVLVQDAATSVVWGMPGAVAGAGLADQVLPLGAIAGELTEAFRPAAGVPAGVTR